MSSKWENSAIKSPSTSIRVFSVYIFLDVRNSSEREVEKSSDKEARFHVWVVMLLGINGVDSLNSKSIVFAKDLVQGKGQWWITC